MDGCPVQAAPTEDAGVQLLDSLRRAFRWHRRTFAALLAAVAVLAGLNALTTGSPDGVPVVVAARTIPGGQRVAAADLAVVHVPGATIPDGAGADPAEFVGRTVVVDVPARAVLTPSVLLDSAGRARTGALALPVRFGESSAVALLRVGSRVDVLGPADGGSGYGVVAADVPVLALPTGGSGGLVDGGGEPLVLLEVSPAQASAIAAAASVSALSFALR